MSIVRSVEESFRTRILPTRWSAAALKRWQAGGDHGASLRAHGRVGARNAKNAAAHGYFFAGADDFGGWAKINKTFFGKSGLWDQLFQGTR